MDKQEFRKNASDMVYLTACAVNGIKPKQERIEKLDLPKLFEVCQKHILTACAAYALESVGIKDTEFTQAKAKAIRKNILLDTERAKILKRLEDEKIWYMPLKGSLLKDWYPKLGMRQMSDNDILCDSGRMKDIYDILIELGFECKHFGKDNDDAYFKEPVLNFEIHRSLFRAEHIGNLYSYFKDVEEKLINDENCEYGRHFTNEDFYLYMIAHEYKHYTRVGTGVRSLLDTYVFLKRVNSSLDWDYVNAELDKLGISEFERSNRELAMNVFSMQKLSDDDKKELDYYVMSEAYGTNDNLIDNAIRFRGDGSKVKYLLYRFFPPVSYIERVVPWAGKSKLLLPFAYIYRMFRCLTVSRKSVSEELKHIRKKDD